MTVNAINGSLMSGLSAVDGVSFSTLTAINGQTLAVIGVPGVASTIIFADGAEHNAAANDKWLQTGANPTIASGATDAHGRYYDCSTNAATLDLGQNLASISCGMRLMSQTDATSQVLLFNDSTNNQLNLQYVAGGAFAIRRNTTTLATGTFTSSLNTWYYVVLSATIDNSGSVTARIYSAAGTLLDTITFTGDTQNTANAFANRVVIGGSANDALLDDIWIASTNVNYGPLRVETVYPDGDGSSSAWTIGAGSGAEWELVDEAQNNDSTDYLIGSNPGEISLFTFADRALTGAIHAVQVTPVTSRAAAVAGVQFRVVARIGGVNYNGSTYTFPSSGFDAHPYSFGTNPATGLAWNSSELASAQFGVEFIAGAVQAWCTQIVLELVTAI